MLVAAIAVAAFSIYKNSSKEEELSDIVKANIEALAVNKETELKMPHTDDSGEGEGGCSGTLVTAYIDISINTSPVPDLYRNWKYKKNNQGDPADNGKCGEKRMRIESIDGQCCSN
jgi:hypothetical protein